MSFASLCPDRVVLTLDRRLAGGGTTAKHLLDALGFQARPFVVGDGKTLPGPAYDYIDQPVEGRAQAYNYACAWLRNIQWAQDDDFSSLALFEDDAVPTRHISDLDSAIEELISLPDSYPLPDLLYLGGNFVNAPVERLGRWLVRPRYPLDLHAIVVFKNAYRRLLEIKPSAEHTLDGILGELVRRGELVAYGFVPNCFVQRAGHSFNENRHDDKSDRHWI